MMHYEATLMYWLAAFLLYVGLYLMTFRQKSHAAGMLAIPGFMALFVLFMATWLVFYGAAALLTAVAGIGGICARYLEHLVLVTYCVFLVSIDKAQTWQEAVLLCGAYQEKRRERREAR